MNKFEIELKRLEEQEDTVNARIKRVELEKLYKFFKGISKYGNQKITVR
jgi:hypothetical protein